MREGGVAVEIQLRTFLQDAWAEAYETLLRTSDLASRSSERREEVAALFRQLSHAMEGVERGSLRGEAATRAILEVFGDHSDILEALQWHLPDKGEPQ